MRYSNTTLRELKSRYKQILIKCAFLNAALLMGLSVATTANAMYKVAGQNVDLNEVENLDLTTFGNTYNSVYGVLYAGEGTSATLTTENIIIGGESKIDSEYGRAVQAKDGGSLIIGDRKTTKSITIQTNKDYGILSLGNANKQLGSNIKVYGQNVSINALGTAVHVGTSVLGLETPASILIDADNINIESKNIALSAMSEGQLELIGNTTITASDAILARGDSKVTINKDNDKTLKMDGNINFNFDKNSSNSPINAFIDVTLNGVVSYWKGNTVVSYDDGTPPTDTDAYLTVSDSSLTIKNGATWQASQIDDKEDYYYTALNNLVVNNGTIKILDAERGISVDNTTITDAKISGLFNVNKEMSVSGNLVLDGSINNNGTINFVNGSTLKTALNGSTVIAGANGTITGETALVLTDVTEGASIVFEGNKDAFKFTENALYDITLSGDKYSITKKATDTIAETVASSGATEQEATAVAAVAGTTSTDETVNAVLNEISTAIQEGNAQKAAAIVKAVNPEVAPVSRVAAASNAVLGAVATRMSALGGAPAPAPTAAARGRSGGDVTVKLSPWIQGLYNKTHNSQGDGFNAYTQGFAFGADVDLTDAWTLGIGYAYTATDVKSDRKTQIYGDNVFAYAQYKPENWYINAVASYGKSNYKQDGTFSTKYDAASYSGQLLTGYDAGLFDTYTGIRYNYIKTDAYNNGIANIKSKNTQIGTFVLGTRISQDFQVKKGFSLTPEFRLAGTYDFKSDNAVSTVGIIGSTASYTVTGDRMSRGAIETGIGLTASVNNFELKFDYDAALRSENNTQSVNLKAIYHF